MPYTILDLRGIKTTTGMKRRSTNSTKTGKLSYQFDVRKHYRRKFIDNVLVGWIKVSAYVKGKHLPRKEVYIHKVRR